MANLITVGRLILLFIVIWMIYVGNVQVVALCMLLIIVVFASDGLDGWVARKRGSTSQFGAIFDIAGDRIVENALWIIFADLQLIPVWVPLMVVTRGFLVDGLLPPSQAAKALDARRNRYPSSTQYGLLNLIDSHDTGRVA